MLTQTSIPSELLKRYNEDVTKIHDLVSVVSRAPSGPEAISTLQVSIGCINIAKEAHARATRHFQQLRHLHKDEDKDNDPSPPRFWGLFGSQSKPAVDERTISKMDKELTSLGFLLGAVVPVMTQRDEERRAKQTMTMGTETRGSET